MKKRLLLITTVSLGLLACGDVDMEEADTLNHDLLSAVDELADETAEVETEEVATDDLYHSEDGRFKVKFLGEPKVSSDVVPTDVGDIEMMSFLYEKSVTEAYMVAYSDYPSAMVEKSSVKDMLVGAKNGSSGNLGITSFDLDEEVELDGNPGMYFKGSANSIYAEYKMFLVASRLYQIAILRDGSYSMPERSDDFFNSFQLVDNAE
ncbi:MAG: hypothetical protein P1U41_00845 [Vicingaceae bacterium]|nr:hypothetical protein [Vicingaceae bacterium]